MTEKAHSILLVDPYVIFRAGLETILRHSFPQAVFGHARTLGEALARLAAERWHLIITDIQLQGRNGLEVIQEARRTQPPVPVLVISGCPVQPYGCRAIRQGAAGYLTKEASEAELLEAVKLVLKGGRYINKDLSLALADAIAAHEDQPLHEKLSNRELHVLIELANGKCIKEIAVPLSLSPKTVSTYRSRVIGKLKLNSDTDLVKYCIKQNLIPPVFNERQKANDGQAME